MASQTKLCVFCRKVEPLSQPCSPPAAIGLPELVTPLRDHEPAMMAELQKHPSVVCRRCSDYDIVRIFKEADAVDGVDKVNFERLTREDNIRYIQTRTDYNKRIDRSRMKLGNLSSLVLSPFCPVCRLIFRILPRKGLDQDTDNLNIAPFRSYIRQTGWDKLVDEYKDTSAILLGIDNIDTAISGFSNSGFGTDNGLRRPERYGEAICLETTHTPPQRRAGNSGIIQPFIDFSFPKRALENCRTHHGPSCQPTKPAELKHIRVLDVEARKVIPYPDGCDYFALSYVWGGVMPAPGALEAGTLPKTIEDAITATKKMGWRYLWVDALCIDQTQNPTPEQRVEKERQLRMMDLIYSSATLTLVAMAGSSSDQGLFGVSPSNPRVPPVKETIGGHTFFTVPAVISFERAASTWASRAWTLQEEVLSRRHLFFTSTQLEISCPRLRIPESLDTTTLEGWGSGLPEILDSLFPSADQTSANPSLAGPSDDEDLFSDVYWLIINDYTSRNMTNDGDSLNALLGMLSVWERTRLSAPCVWGLPLATHPQSLGWMHPRDTKPRRRADFPSWSWAGWEGGANIDLLLRQVSAATVLPGVRDPVRDLTVRYVGLDGKKLTVEGWIVDLDIRTEPFSEVMVPGTDELMGMVVERNFSHPMTLPSGTYSCLVVDRVKYRIVKDGKVFQKVFMLVLEWAGEVARRRTVITLTTVGGGDFLCVKPARREVALI